jgi:hypothetical protein
MTLSYVDIKELPLVNKKQILFDWINTINQPRCLLVSQSKDLLNGDAFIEMLFHFLEVTNNKEMNDNIQRKGVELETPEIKVKIVLDCFYEICKKNFEYNKRIKVLLTMIKNIFEKEEVLIEMVELIREIYDAFNITNMLDNEINKTNVKEIKNEQPYQQCEQQYNLPYMYNTNVKCNNNNNELHAKRYLTIQNNNHISNNKRNNYFTTYPNTHSLTISNQHTYNNTGASSSCSSSKQNKSHSVRNLSHNNNTNFINIIDHSTTPSLPHYSSSKFLKSTTNMTRGIFQINKALFNLDYPLPRLKYFKYHKPTEPIITCNSKTISTYKPISTYNKHIEQPQLTTSCDDLIINTTSNNNNNDIHKKRLYKWLIYLNIIKEELISIEQIPLLCSNGVLLSDLINKCEGRFPTIKGISRYPMNQTQIKANITKMLSYLESNEKFKSKYLWSSSDIMSGDVDVIWGLLYDVYVYYNTKDKMRFVNRLSRSKERYDKLKKDKQNEKYEIITNNRGSNGLYRNGIVNKNHINHIMNCNGENDMLMKFICKKKNEQKLNKLMGIEHAEMRMKGNNSNCLSERDKLKVFTGNTKKYIQFKDEKPRYNTGDINRQRFLKGNRK